MVARAVMHDETVYHDPEDFIPERFLDEDAPDCLNFAFGFGRR
jgi:cytochrome P450